MKVFNCNQCDKTFDKRRKLKYHNNYVHLKKFTHIKVKKVVTCKICNKNFDSKYLKAHQTSVHLGIKSVSCDECGKSFSNKSDLKRHLKNVHLKIKRITKGESIKNCDKCDMSFHTIEKLKTHLKNIHDVVKLSECKECKKSFTTNGRLQSHITQTHKGGSHVRQTEKVTCDLCQKVFASHYLKYHKDMVHFKVKKFKCEHCDKEFCQKSDWNRHKLRMHKNVDFTEDNESIDKHMTDQTTFDEKEGMENSDEEKEVISDLDQDLIPVSMASTETLENGESIFESENYDTEEIMSENLDSGEEVPKGKVRCTECQKLVSKSNLKLHVDMVHLKLKNYACFQCGKDFCQKGDLKRHFKQVHKNFEITQEDLEKSLIEKKFTENFSNDPTEQNQVEDQNYDVSNDEDDTENYESIDGVCSKTGKSTASIQNNSENRTEGNFEDETQNEDYSNDDTDTYFASVFGDDETIDINGKTEQSNIPNQRSENGTPEAKKSKHDFTNNPEVEQKDDDENLLDLPLDRVKCKECQKPIRKVYLNQHINMVHLGLKKFKCGTCDKDFKQKCDLNRHVKNVHKIIKQEPAEEEAEMEIGEIGDEIDDIEFEIEPENSNETIHKEEEILDDVETEPLEDVLEDGEVSIFEESFDSTKGNKKSDKISIKCYKCLSITITFKHHQHNNSERCDICVKIFLQLRDHIAKESGDCKVCQSFMIDLDCHLENKDHGEK